MEATQCPLTDEGIKTMWRAHVDNEDVLMWQYELTKSAVEWDENVLWSHTIHVGGGNVLHTTHKLSGLLFSLKRKEILDISYNIDAKLNKPITKGHMLYDFIHIGVWSSRIYRDRKKHGGWAALKEGK